MLDLSRPASQHGTTSCFARDQPGSYFNGSGYAVLSEFHTAENVDPAEIRVARTDLRVSPVREGYKVGSDVSVSLEFRTSQSEGVFLGISSAKVDAIGLEMIDGRVSRGQALLTAS